MTIAWGLSLFRRNASIVDAAWGLVCALVAWVYFVGSGVDTSRALLATVLTTVWGVRLAVHLFRRSWSGGEEWRYRRLRERSPRWFPVASLFSVFWLQGLAAIAVTLPLLAANHRAQPLSLGFLDWIGVSLWLVGFLFEAIGDYQLAGFLSKPSSKGRVLDRGLWRYTRHPNYFGDAVQWWGLGLIGAAAGPWWALLGPAGMTVVLLWVTGKAPAERHLCESRGHAYQEYRSRTSGFIPWPPRKVVGRRGQDL